jgi:branched-chain amino acid transport system permease protein
MVAAGVLLDLAQNTLDGLAGGASYALIGLGFTLVFGVMRRLNLAYGPTILAGAYLGALAHATLGLGALAVAPIVVLGAALAGFYVERLCFRPFGPEAAMASLVSSFVLWMQFEEAASLLLPSHTNAFPRLAGGPPLAIGPLTLRLDQLVVLAVALVALAGVRHVLVATRPGLGLRAMIENPRAAELVGIPVRGLALAAFAGASALGGLAGFLILAAEGHVTPMLGMWATTKGLVAMMLGGLGSLPGAVVGGLLLGVVEAHAQWFLGPQLRDLTTWGLLLVVLVAFPGGLAGGAVRARALLVAKRV